MVISHFFSVRTNISRPTGRSTTPVEASSGQEWQYKISTVRAHPGRSTGRSTTPVEASSGQEWQLYISTIRTDIGRSTGRSRPQYRHLVVKNGNFTLLLLDFILADQLADLAFCRGV